MEVTYVISTALILKLGFGFVAVLRFGDYWLLASGNKRVSGINNRGTSKVPDFVTA